MITFAMTACNNTSTTVVPTSESPDKANYKGNQTNWTYRPECDDNQLLNWLVTIDCTTYDTAGSSIHQAVSAVALMELAMDENDDIEKTIKTYLAGMNNTQKDYFSFQWQQALTSANNALESGYININLNDLEQSLADFDIKKIDRNKVDELNDTMTILLNDAGVTNEWKAHTDIFPFDTLK